MANHEIHRGGKVIKYERFLFSLLCCALIWIPLPGASNRDWSMFGWSAFIFVISSLCCIALVFGWLRISNALKKSWPALVCLVFVQVWTFLQWLPGQGWSLDRTASFRVLLLGLAYTSLFAMLLQLLSANRVKALMIVIFISAVGQALYGAMMVLTGLEWGFFMEKIYFQRQATGTFINPNHFAAYLNLGLAIGVAFLMVNSRKLKGTENIIGRTLNVMMSGSLGWRLALIVLVVGLVMSSSRMGNTSFVIALFIAASTYMLIKRRLMLAWIILLASIVLIDAIIIGTRFGVDRLVEEVANTVVVEEVRASVFQAALPMVGDYFWFGSGAGSFYSVFPMYRLAPVGSDFYNHAHNDYLEFIIELGIVGFLPLLAFIALTLRAAYRACTVSKSNWKQIAGYSAYMAIVAIGVHSTADFSLRIPAYAATFIALCAAVFWAANGGGHRRRRHSSSHA